LLFLVLPMPFITIKIYPNKVDRPKVKQAEFQILTESQAQQFLIATTGSEFETVFFLALTTSMRQGELLGLKWSDVDWEKGTLLVQR
jgi:integrase